MPLPKPNDGEAREAFISRCMADNSMNSEFPDRQQRYAVCVRQFERKQAAEEAEGREKPDKYLDTVVKVDDADDADHTLTLKITTDAKDHDNEVVLPTGADFGLWRKNPVVTFGHRYDLPPVAKGLWVKRLRDGIISKCRMVAKWASPVGNNPDFPMQLFEMYKAGDMRGASVGMRLKEKGTRALTEDDLKLRPDWKGVWRIIEKWLMLEYALCTVPCNPEALLERAKSLGMNDDSLKLLAPPMLPEGEMADCAACGEVIELEYAEEKGWKNVVPDQVCPKCGESPFRDLRNTEEPITFTVGQIKSFAESDKIKEDLEAKYNLDAEAASNVLEEAWAKVKAEHVRDLATKADAAAAPDEGAEDEASKQEYHCSCTKCGYEETYKDHCREHTCPKCGGEMRRADRPGPGDGAGADGKEAPEIISLGRPMPAPGVYEDLGKSEIEPEPLEVVVQEQSHDDGPGLDVQSLGDASVLRQQAIARERGKVYWQE